MIAKRNEQILTCSGAQPVFKSVPSPFLLLILFSMLIITNQNKSHVMNQKFHPEI